MSGLAFRAFDPARDAQVMFDLYRDPFEQALFAQRVPLTTLAEFEEWLDGNMRGNYHEFRVICDAEGGQLAGFVFAYDYRPFDLHCKVCVYMRPKWRGSGAAGLMGARFMGGLFCTYPLRKIYALVYGYNAESLRSNLQAGFVEEAVLREYRYLGGAWHDCHVLSLSRQAYEEGLGKLVQRGRQGARADGPGR